MKIKVTKFLNSLFENKQTSICLLASFTQDEPIFRKMVSEAWRQVSQELGFKERTVFYQEKDNLCSELNNSRLINSLFSNRIMIEVNLTKNKIDKSTAIALFNWAKESPTDKRLLINAPALDSAELKSIWFQQIEFNGVIIDTSKLDPNDFDAWGKDYCDNSNVKLNKESINFIIDHANDSPNEIVQTINRLSMLQKEKHDDDLLDIELVMASCNSLHLYPIRQILDEAMACDMVKLSISMKEMINQKSDILSILPVIRREIGILLSLKSKYGPRSSPSHQHLSYFGIDEKRRDLFKNAINRLSLTTLRRLVVLCQNADASAKGLNIEPAWLLIRDLLYMLAGSDLRK